jgi:hypothetical protein
VQCQCEIGSHGGLADAALSAGDRDDVPNALNLCLRERGLRPALSRRLRWSLNVDANGGSADPVYLRERLFALGFDLLRHACDPPSSAPFAR